MMEDMVITIAALLVIAWGAVTGYMGCKEAWDAHRIIRRRRAVRALTRGRRRFPDLRDIRRD